MARNSASDATWRRCYFCGKYISYADLAAAVVWTPYGEVFDLEPRPDERAHGKCWNAAEERYRALIRDTSWQKPCVSDGATVRAV